MKTRKIPAPQLFLVIATFAFCTQTKAQPVENEVLAPIVEVKLHLDGAEIIRKTSVVLQGGRNHFLLPDLSSKIYPQTIQVLCSDPGVKIISVTSKTNFLRKGKEDRRILELRDSVELVRSRVDGLGDEKMAYEEERELLRQNRDFKGDDKTLTVVELKGAADFYRSRMQEINKALTRINNGLTENHRRLFDLKLQLQELNAKLEPTSEIHLVFESLRTTRSEVDIRYVVRDAGWAAIYDLESGDLAKPVILKYRALAFNNTGIDWDNVKLTLSTADPLQSASQPALKVWTLNEYSADQIALISNLSISNINDMNFQIQQNSISVYNRLKVDVESNTRDAKRVLGPDYDAGVDYDTDLYRRYQEERANAPMLNTAVFEVPEINVDFPIDAPYSIPSDKKPYSIDIQRFELPVTYKYFAAPKLDRDAFLLAQIVGWEELNLVSGPVNVYQGKKYIGQSNLDIRNLSDTLSVSMGRDKNVVVTRLKVKGKTRSQILGTTKKSSVAYNISVRNNHSLPIEIEIQDQVPISNDKEVIVTIDEMSNAVYQDKIGVLSWTLTLAPTETKTIEFGFSIRYPKNKAVQIQHMPSKEMHQKRYF